MMKVHFGNMASGYTSTIETQNRRVDNDLALSNT